MNQSNAVAGRLKFSIDLLQGLFDDKNLIGVPADKARPVVTIKFTGAVVFAFSGLKPSL